MKKTSMIDYNILRKGRKLKGGGGLAISTTTKKKDLLVKEIRQEITENVELVAVDVITKELQVTVATNDIIYGTQDKIVGK